MNRDGLKKIYLIKSAGYEFAEVDIADNTLLLGESGVGKTTLMRAVLFFYTMDYSDSVLNLTSETKKSFNDWYFKEHNSHIVYEYTKDENRYLFVVSKSSKLHYTFIDITAKGIEVRDLFIQENKPVELETLHENIQKNGVLSYSTTIRERYINTFHKRDSFLKKIKQESVVDFYLFEDIKSRQEFARTLSNIFASSSIRSTNIKKTIVSLIDNSTAKIALNDIRINLNKFVQEKHEIEKFERKIPLIKELALEYGKYKQNKQEFKAVANRVVFIHRISSLKIKELEIALQERSVKQQQEQQKYEIKKEMIEERLLEQKTQIALKNSSLEQLVQKEQYFQTQQIVKLLAEYKQEQQYKEEKKALQSRYEALTSDVAEVEQRYEKLLFMLEKNYQNKLATLEQELSSVIVKENEKINSLIEEKESKIANATCGYNDEKTLLHQRELEIQEALLKLNKKQGELQHFPFKKELLAEYEESIKHYNEKLLEVKVALLDNKEERVGVEKSLQEIKEYLLQQNSVVETAYIQVKEELLEKKRKIEQRLDFESQNLYGYLSRNDVPNREKIVTYLKDDILFCEKEFRVKSITNAQSIFGMEVEFEEQFENEYEQEQLLGALKHLKLELKELNKQTQKQRYKLEDSAAKQSKEKNRQRSALYKIKEELEGTQKSYIQKLESLEVALTQTKKEAKEEQIEALKKLDSEFISLENEKKRVTKQLEFLVQKIEEITHSITLYINKEIAQAREIIVQTKVSYTKEKSSLENRFEVDKKRYKEEKIEALHAKGIEHERLEQLLKLQEEVELKLQEIEKNRKLVYSFLEIKDEFEKISFYRVEVEQLTKEYEEIEKSLEFYISSFKEEQSKRSQELHLLQTNKEKIELFLKKYAQRIANTNIETTIEKLLILDYSTEVDEVESEEIEQLLDIYKAIKTNESEIKSYVIRALKDLKFDNIFKIEIVRDFIEDIEYTKTAKDLVEYIQKDKLTPLKDALFEQFKGEIRKITKELDIFEDALLDIYAQIRLLANTMRKAVESFNVIDSIEIRAEETNNNLLHTLRGLATYYETHSNLFLNGLFDTSQLSAKDARKELDTRVIELVDLLNSSKEYLELEDGFVLEFKIVEKGNNLKWRQNIDDIGSNGTSTLVKSVINISMLQMMSKNIVKEAQILTHCVLDEIGTISTDYFRELKEFVNRSGFVFLNGMPIEDDMLISMYPTIYIGQNHNNYSKMILASKMEL